MAYSIVKCRRTEFAVDWEVVERLCMSYWLTAYQLELSNAVTLSQSTWYNPFSWKLPEIQTVDVDWDAVRDRARARCAADLFAYGQQAGSSMPDIAAEMEVRVQQTAVQRRNFVNWMKDLQATNLRAMEAAVDDYRGLIEASRFVRDTSADVVAIGSTIATGGAAAGLLGASSALKGYGKYQDTGRVGASVLYGTGQLVLGAFKIGGAKLTASQEYTLIIAQGVLEGGTALAAGDGFAKAVTAGGLKVASAGSAQALFGSAWVKNIFARIPVPVNVWLPVRNEPGWKAFEDVSGPLLEKTAKKAFEKGVKAGLGAAGKAPAAAEPPAADRRSASGYMDHAPVEQMLLLYLSIVNMEKGIGRGW